MTMTTIGIISDIHGNQPALDAVLAALDNHDVDDVLCVGDIVGLLGASNACVDAVREHCSHAVYGNHDSRFFPDRNWVAVHDFDIAEYEQVMEGLTDENYTWLTSLPEQVTAYDTITLVHAHPDSNDPAGIQRGNAGIKPRDFAEKGSEHVDGGVLLLGHTHKQHAVNLDKFDGQSGLILNPGSVGFPFDHRTETDDEDDTETVFGKASYATLDPETQAYSLETVEYDATRVVEFLERWGLR